MSPPVADDAPEGMPPPLRCANRHTPKHAAVEATGGGSTMVRIGPHWNVLPIVDPANGPTDLATPVAAFGCSVCGYVELYAGVILAPDLFVANRGPAAPPEPESLQ